MCRYTPTPALADGRQCARERDRQSPGERMAQWWTISTPFLTHDAGTAHVSVCPRRLSYAPPPPQARDFPDEEEWLEADRVRHQSQPFEDLPKVCCLPRFLRRAFLEPKCKLIFARLAGRKCCAGTAPRPALRPLFRRCRHRQRAFLLLQGQIHGGQGQGFHRQGVFPVDAIGWHQGTRGVRLVLAPDVLLRSIFFLPLSAM